MSEWRNDPITNRWVVIATERGKRPFDYKEIVEERQNKECPLCIGNEEQTPPEIMSCRESGSLKDGPGWWVRVVPNKFPAVSIKGEPDIFKRGIYQVMPGVGAHEVIVESSDHEPGLDSQTEKQIEDVIWVWQERLQDLRKDARLKYIQIFKNTGSTAGASLEHTHSQLIAIPQVPDEIKKEIKGIKEYADRHGTCVFCDIVRLESENQERVVLDSDHFLNFAPFASRFPFENWIVPKEHQHDFGLIQEKQVKDLAKVLRSTLRKMNMMIKNIPYNVVLHTAPVNVLEEHQYHWHLEILPRLTIMAGFELGTGCYINPTPPEVAAQAFKETEEIYEFQNKKQEVFHYV